jgi:hypothetical protein
VALPSTRRRVGFACGITADQRLVHRYRFRIACPAPIFCAVASLFDAFVVLLAISTLGRRRSHAQTVYGTPTSRSSDRGGFVVVELLVVIIILALLVAMVIIGLSNLSAHR